MKTISLTQYCADCRDEGLSPYGYLQVNAQILYGAFHAEWVDDSIGVKSLLRLDFSPLPEDIRR